LEAREIERFGKKDRRREFSLRPLRDLPWRRRPTNPPRLGAAGSGPGVHFIGKPFSIDALAAMIESMGFQEAVPSVVVALVRKASSVNVRA